MRRILLRRSGGLYRLLQFDFHDHADGSLYIIFDRTPQDGRVFTWSSRMPEPVEIEGGVEKLRISYHTTGRVNFHGHTGDTIFCEPTFAITREQLLCCISIPLLERLPAKDKASSSDFVADVGDDLDGRINFLLHIAPNNFKPEGSGVAIEYASWFKIWLQLGSLIEPVPDDWKDHFITFVSQTGPFPSQPISVGNAIIAFHQKAQGTANQVAYFEPNEGIYRLIFAVEKSMPPCVNIEFVDPFIEAEVIAINHYQLKFRAKSPAGYVKRETLPIRSITLDARL
jgi:hypothetical protein